MWTWPRVPVRNLPCERCMVCNLLTIFWMTGVCSCLFLDGRVVMSSFCRSCTTLPMMGTWVLAKHLKLCNSGSGGLKCSSMSSRLFMVVQFVKGLKTCRRHLLVCSKRYQYPMAGLSIGPLTSSQAFLKLMGLMPC